MTRQLDPQAELLLNKSAEDEATIRADIPDGPFGFHAQEAVEKLFKAFLAQLGIRYSRTHDLIVLRNMLAAAGEPLPTTPVELSKLIPFAVPFRYEIIPADGLDRGPVLETVRILREYVTARIASLTQ